MFGCALWTHWSERNKLIHDRKQKSRKDISYTIGWYLRELDDTEVRMYTRSRMEAKWRPPTGLIVKINFDGAFEKKSSRLCSGIVARNAYGEVLVSRAIIHPNIGSPSATEAIAYLWAVKTST
ncbi:hypothetical protein Gohar_024567 [Gossypium harknessii]|uniref:RNase H type-1 domain-containing protein n=1 Tax=Gossypium harknessii TaxID=34285 RepID=A0A7J9HGE5_9ROSI|nr:hypothetical protein [Gossypium harknessii]